MTTSSTFSESWLGFEESGWKRESWSWRCQRWKHWDFLWERTGSAELERADLRSSYGWTVWKSVQRNRPKKNPRECTDGRLKDGCRSAPVEPRTVGFWSLSGRSVPLQQLSITRCKHKLSMNMWGGGGGPGGLWWSCPIMQRCMFSSPLTSSPYDWKLRLLGEDLLTPEEKEDVFMSLWS